MYATFNDLKALNPKITNIMYLNSMFDFSMYRLHGQALALESAGTRVLLRDKTDKLVLLCNDGNYFCSKRADQDRTSHIALTRPLLLSRNLDRDNLFMVLGQQT